MSQENQTIPGTGNENNTPENQSDESARALPPPTPREEADPFRPVYIPDPPEGDDFQKVLDPLTGVTQADVNARYEAEVSQLYGCQRVTSRAVQAAIDFNPQDSAIQPAELYSFSDAEYEKDGYF